jgi:hypothetical protein
MKSRHISIYGSAGALPLWIDSVNMIVNSPDYRKSLQMADLVFDTGSEKTVRGEAFKNVPLLPKSGLPAALGPDAVSGSFPRALTELELQDNTWTLKRAFEPLQGVQHGKE